MDKKGDITHILGNVSHSQVTSSTSLNTVSAIHLLEPLTIDHVDLTLGVQFPLPSRQQLSSPVLGTGMVECRKDLVGNSSSDVRNKEESVSKGRRCQLIVLGERSLVDVEALRTRVDDHDIRD